MVKEDIMANVGLDPRELSSRALATGVPRDIGLPILELFQKWCSLSGEEWAVSRMKSLKLYMIHKQAGIQPALVWVAKSRKGNLSGVLGGLEVWMRKSPSNFARGIQLLQMYTSKFSREVTPLQKNKFVTAVESTLPEGSSIVRAIEVLKSGLRKSKLRTRLRPLPLAKRLLDMPSSPTKRAPTLVWGPVSEDEGVVDSITYLSESYMGWSHYLEFKVFYDPVLKELKEPTYDVGGSYHPLGWQPIRPAGRIGLIQEPGYKLRAVANPGRIFQRVLEPLGDSIYALLKKLPWDCTFDQVKAFPILQSCLASGRTVHSIDLSNATDYFPLALQEFVLKTLFPGTHGGKSIVDLFTSLSKADWWMDGHGWIRWTRGQPLGLYPSFGSFALTHGLLLLGLVPKWDNQFFILGDDVVILDTQLANQYTSILAKLGCPVSVEKSLVSNKLCEFGGKLVTSGQIVSQLKWRDVSDDSFIDIARLLGPRSLGLFRNRQRKVIQRISEVPEFLGGMGWNPKGKPLEDRLHHWVFEDNYKPQPRVTSLSRMRVHRLMTSNLVQQAAELRRKADLVVTYTLPADDLDQRSIALLQRHIPRLAPWYMIAGKNLDWVFEALDQDLDLPIQDEGGTTRSSTLLRWERVLTPMS